MENYTVVIFILAVMIGLSAVADKIRLPYPIILITAGIAVGFIPDLPHIELAPEIVLLIFLPPLLYDAAFNISMVNFRTHFNTISTLAITLVFVTTTAIAVTAYYLIPGMTWPLSFVLGAILSATDAVSAISITKGLGISHKTTTILEGESLINDASALVAYRFAVAAVTGTAFVFWKASLQFALLLVGGMTVGLVLGRITAWMLKYTQKNSQVTVSLMLLMPLVTYLIAEQLHVSGVIAVVILGLGISRFSNHLFHEQLQQQSKSIWEIIVFLLNGLIFILIGLQLPYLLDTLEKDLLLPYIGYAFLINVVAILLRTAWVFLQRRNLLKAFSLKNEKRKVTKDALLDFKTSLIISWSGMRGIVSLAIAIGLPTHLQNGAPFPHRTAIIFISLVVVLFTILGQGLTLPLLVKKLGIKKEEEFV